ncbi:MAG: O-acetyl-ADP-ribose deacetylase [Campylobacteraceae bacterium 4484_4]|nr:MAG: O-acetyl-ADP-ribose deacetylase [Campylobacteraceae bacterium 4484_4]
MGEIVVKTGDITKEEVCAIVNAANRSLMGGGGVDGAIHRAGGPKILEEAKKIRQTRYPDGLPTGEAVATTGGDLPAEYVIHTVGPVYPSCQKRCKKLLSNAYLNSLRVAKALGCESVAFPAISTGVYGYPKEEAARIAYQTVRRFLEKEKRMKIIFVFHSFEDAALFKQVNHLD